MILPLATRRDIAHPGPLGPRRLPRTGSARDAEGMWLPETAVNDDVLAVLAEEGVRLHDPGAVPGLEVAAPRPW